MVAAPFVLERILVVMGGCLLLLKLENLAVVSSFAVYVLLVIGDVVVLMCMSDDLRISSVLLPSTVLLLMSFRCQRYCYYCSVLSRTSRSSSPRRASSKCARIRSCNETTLSCTENNTLGQQHTPLTTSEDKCPEMGYRDICYDRIHNKC